MSYLAYDPSRLEALRDRMHRAIHELWFFGSGDPLAVDATAAITDARRQLTDAWIPLVERITASTAMTLLTSFHVDGDELVDVMLRRMTTEHGWAVIDEVDLGRPATGVLAVPLSVDETTALGEVLQRDTRGRLTDTDEERIWLATQLTMIAADPALAGAFALAFMAWSPLIERLGTLHLSTSFERSMTTDEHMRTAGEATVASIEQLDAGLARAFAAVHGEGALPDLDDVQPYGAAQLVTHAGLAPARLADVTFQILGRVVDHRPLVGWDDEQYQGPKTADVLFAALLATPGSTTPFVIAAATDPERLWWTANDPTLAQRVAADGTDPTQIDTLRARDVITSFVGYVRGQDAYQFRLRYTSSPSESSAFLGELVAPWLLQFAPLGADWGTSSDDIARRRDVLAAVLSNDGALERLLDAQQSIQAGLVAASERTPTTMDAYASIVGLMSELIVGGRVLKEQQRKELWDKVWQVADIAISVGLLFTSLPVASRPLVKGALDQTYAFISQQGWLNAPAPARVAKDQEYWQQRMIVSATAIMVRVTFDQMVDSGRLAADTPPPPDPALDTEDPVVDYGSRYAVWRDRQLAGTDPALISELGQMKGFLLSSTQVGEAAAD